jgi:hypothetical protein
MGTDIHGVLQAKHSFEGATWFTECRMEDDRNYRLFAALADVRNGSGFAGVKTHDPITPIAEPRGWPDDFELSSITYVTDDPWLGDHSFSWLTLDEVVNWDGWDQPLHETGIIDRKQFEAWDGVNPPEGGWCGGIYGQDIVKVDARDEATWAATRDWTHVNVYWSRPLRESCTTFLAWVEYAKEKTRGMEARLVFGFDS